MSDLSEYSGPWAGSRQVCNFLDIDLSELARRTANREVLGRTFSDGSVSYPTGQFVDGQVVEGLAAVLDVLATYDADPNTWTLWMTGSPGGGPTNWELLLAGHVETVLTEARRGQLDL